MLEKTLKSIERLPLQQKRIQVSVKYDTEGSIIIEKFCDRRAKAIEDSSDN